MHILLFSISTKRESQQILSFITHDATLTPKVFAFWLLECTSHCQSAMNTIMAGLLYKNAIIYMDDLAVFHKIIEDH